MTVVVGTQYKVVSPELAQAANIESAYKLFYEGSGEGASGVETYLLSLKNRIETLEVASSAGGTFYQGTFKIYQTNGSPTSFSLLFGVSQLTANKTVVIPNFPSASSTMVLEDHSQSLTNKTISGSTNILYIRYGNFRIQKTDSDYLTFDLTAVTGTQAIGIRDWSGTDYLVTEGTSSSLEQVLTNKKFVNYRESVLDTSISTIGGTATIDSSLYNIAYVTFNSSVTSGNVDITNLDSGESVLIICKGTSANTTPTIKVGGQATIKWAGGTSPGVISTTAGRWGAYAISKIGSAGESFGSYLGEYY